MDERIIIILCNLLFIYKLINHQSSIKSLLGFLILELMNKNVSLNIKKIYIYCIV